MANVIVIPAAKTTQNSQPKRACNGREDMRLSSTADYRRLLSDLKLRPASQRAFLRKLLRRAAMNSALYDFPVAAPQYPTSNLMPD